MVTRIVAQYRFTLKVTITRSYDIVVDGQVGLSLQKELAHCKVTSHGRLQ